MNKDKLYIEIVRPKLRRFSLSKKKMHIKTARVRPILKDDLFIKGIK
jgi:hypothetical protein